jgi:cytosine/adenosine deaminase-related metal-dependent hydrolase
LKENKVLLTAAWVAPMGAPMIRDGGVVFEGGRISAIGGAAELRRAHCDAEVHEAGNAVILPGLVNAHTHLELSDIAQGESPAGLAPWILNLMSKTARLGDAMPEVVGRAVGQGVAQCLRFGVTSVGDISKQCMFSRPVLKDGPLRVVSYGEIQAMARRRGLLDERFAIAADISMESEWLRVGITPHAPYTVEAEGYAKCLDFARLEKRPIATHLAETADEGNFLENHSGPFRDLWETGVNAWDDHVGRFVGGPIRFARQVGLLDYPSLLAHVNYCDDGEMEILAGGKASVVYCPRTHLYFGHPKHRWREMLGMGINVAVGTDSCASSENLNLVDDLRLLHQIAPEISAEMLWEMATIRGARAIQADQQVGSLSIGKFADAVVFPVRSERPLLEILESDVEPTAVWIAGRIMANRPALPG